MYSSYLIWPKSSTVAVDVAGDEMKTLGKDARVLQPSKATACDAESRNIT